MSNCLILADQIYQDQSGKYIIAGTYTGWSKRIAGWEQAIFDAPNGLALYGRFTPERFGELELNIAVKDRNRRDWNESWLRTCIKLQIKQRDQLPAMIDFHLRTCPSPSSRNSSATQQRSVAAKQHHRTQPSRRNSSKHLDIFFTLTTSGSANKDSTVAPTTPPLASCPPWSRSSSGVEQLFRKQ